ncbi:hypothetical protein EDB89DRAFT_470591 [Lactarius sanguifluus]|nr:hypothetical protein EDB89DRAFT_470591 [Lactarius sanguifluus]
MLGRSSMLAWFYRSLKFYSHSMTCELVLACFTLLPEKLAWRGGYLMMTASAEGSSNFNEFTTTLSDEEFKLMGISTKCVAYFSLDHLKTHVHAAEACTKNPIAAYNSGHGCALPA